MSFFNSLLIVFLHKENSPLFDEWFSKKGKFVIWKPLFNLCQDFFSFLESKKIIYESGVKAFLLHHLPSSDKLYFNKKRIFLDLSFSFDLCEKEIFKEISHHKEVLVLSPELENQTLLEQSSFIYQKLEEELSSQQVSYFKKIQESHKSLPTSFFKIKSETQIEELRKALIQICEWLKAGVPAKDIAIFAPHIEDYWFALKTYFEREKILVKKSISTRGIDFPDLKYFLSSIRVHLGYFTFEDLEHFSFHKESKKNFSKFKAYYSQIPDRELVKKLLIKNKIRSHSEKMKGSQFIEWALSFWPKEGDSFLLEKISKVFQKFPMEGSLKASSWLRLFESEIFNIEVEVKEEESQGVSCLSFNAFHSVKSSYVFIMGLNEESLKPSPFKVLNESEKQSLLDDLGFPLPFVDSKEKENNLLWFLQSSQHKEVIFKFLFL